MPGSGVLGEPAVRIGMLQNVMITCPSTNLTLPTGVQLSEAVFATAVFTNVRVQCPHCETEHRWNKADAFLQDAPPRAYGESPPARLAPRRPKS